LTLPPVDASGLIEAFRGGFHEFRLHEDRRLHALLDLHDQLVGER
jgi:hypothetical protein